MNAYLIQSLAPLVFRTAKPFCSQASAQELAFPLPSTSAGLIRYLALSQGKVDKDFYDKKYEDLLKIGCYGVYLAKFSDNDDIQLYLPKPANALCLENKETGDIELIALAPKAFDDNSGSDLPNGLLPIAPQKSLKGKPKGDIKYWHLDDVIAWQNGKSLDYKTIEQNGLKNIPTDIRTHIAIDDNTLTTEDKALFQTASFDLGHQKVNHSFDSQRLGFVILSEQALDDDLANFGGERRLSYFKQCRKPLFNPATAEQINQAKGFCLTFITPCIFAKGYLPSWIDENTMQGTLPNSGVQVALQAVAVERWQAVSGWDSKDYKPKATRKAVPAGSVYWFRC